MRTLNFVGSRFGFVSVLSEAEPYFSPKGHRDRQFNCRCDCGKEWIVRSSSIRRGITSCGCVPKPSVKHGHSRRGSHSATYKIWAGVVQRCTNPKSSRFAEYGGRGIAVCNRWRESYEAFFADMGERPPGLTIEREDNERGYEPGNCRWATMREQSRNRRSSSKLDYETLTEAAHRLGLNHAAICNRIRRGWSRERAFTTPRWHKSFN